MKVFIQRTQNRRKFIEEVFERELKGEIEKAKRILLKPNIVSSEPYPTTTHPEVLESLFSILLKEEKQIIVADGPAFDAGNSQEIIENHPLKKVCDEFNVPLVNLNAQKMRKIKTESFEFELPSFIFQFDFVISLPVLKSHQVCGLTGALKNQYGFLSPPYKQKFHRMNIHKAIAELNRILKPDFWIIDAIKTLVSANERRHGGRVRELGFMLAGKDPVSLDIEGLNLLKKVDPSLRDKNPEDILHLKWALRLGKTKLFDIIE